MLKPLLLLCALACGAAAAPDPARLARSVTVHRDGWGVPHIYGPSDASVVFGLMYAQAEDNFWQLEETFIRDLGRAAEVHGPSRLRDDLMVRLFESERLAKEEMERAAPASRALYEAFAAGLNWYLHRHPEVKPRLIARFEPWHILALHNSPPSLARLGIRHAEIAAAYPGIGAAAPPEAEAQDEGSNMWAVAPARSASGRALLLINPHVGFFGGGQRYEAHLRSGQGLNVAGFAILGTPYIRSGHNERLGWSHTNNYADVVDVYSETFDDTLTYRYGQGRRQAAAWTTEIRVKTDAGFETRRFTLRKTHHGPIVAVRDGHPLAVRRHAPNGLLEQRWAMARARSLAEFKAAWRASRSPAPIRSTPTAPATSSTCMATPYRGAPRGTTGRGRWTAATPKPSGRACTASRNFRRSSTRLRAGSRTATPQFSSAPPKATPGGRIIPLTWFLSLTRCERSARARSFRGRRSLASRSSRAPRSIPPPSRRAR